MHNDSTIQTMYCVALTSCCKSTSAAGNTLNTSGSVAQPPIGSSIGPSLQPKRHVAKHECGCWVGGSRPIAATLALLEGSTYYSAHIAHDNEFARYSPGTLLESIELEDLMRERRFHTYDFLAGALQNKNFMLLFV